jgi:hypothetical protein
MGVPATGRGAAVAALVASGAPMNQNGADIPEQVVKFAPKERLRRTSVSGLTLSRIDECIEERRELLHCNRCLWQ